MRYKVTELKELLSKYEKQIDEFIAPPVGLEPTTPSLAVPDEKLP